MIPRKSLKFRRLPLALFFLLSIAAQSGQINPPTGVVFDDTHVPRIDIIIHPDSLALIFSKENVLSDHEYPSTFIFTTKELSDTIKQVGFRLRGNSSRGAAKKSYKVSFNTFSKGRKYHGLEKLNLNGERKDPSMLRAKLSWDFIRSRDLPGSRANHVQLYINGEYFGLQLNVEHIDEEFTRTRYGSAEGDLFKCLFPADLKYRGENGLNYQHKSGRRRVYELKGSSENGYDKLASFISMLNREPDSTFVQSLENIFAIDEYLRTLACEMLLGHWDNLTFNSNNFYFYFDDEIGQIRYLTYDLDSTFGLDFNQIDWARRSIFAWHRSVGSSPLYRRVMAVPKYRQLLISHLEKGISGYFNETILPAKAKKLHTMIAPFMEADSLRTKDYGYSKKIFDHSLDSSFQNHVRYGIRPFITERAKSVKDEIE